MNAAHITISLNLLYNVRSKHSAARREACPSRPRSNRPTGARAVHRFPSRHYRAAVCSSAVKEDMAYYQVVSDEPFFRGIELEDVERVASLEAAGYPEDEAASLEQITFRAKSGEDGCPKVDN